jgi:hypothetical protein
VATPGRANGIDGGAGDASNAKRRDMRFRHLLILAVLVVPCAAGCAPDLKAEAQQQLSQIGAKELRIDAARIYKDVFAGRAPAFEEVRPAVWPASFQAFHPHHVGAAPDGISLSLARSREGESGLYIVPWQMERVPAATSHASFQPLAEGIYWYSFRD